MLRIQPVTGGAAAIPDCIGQVQLLTGFDVSGTEAGQVGVAVPAGDGVVEILGGVSGTDDEGVGLGGGVSALDHSAVLQMKPQVSCGYAVSA